MLNLDKYTKNNHLKVLVKPNSNKTEILGYNESKKAIQIAINAPSEDNKANIELIKFLHKLLKKKVSIKSGLRSREKLIKII